MAILELNDVNFTAEILKSDLPALVDFWAPWCGPCKMIAPIVEDVSKEYVNKLKIGKLNIDDNPQTPTRYGVMSIPTIMFFKKGKAVDQIVGALSKSDLKKKIEENLNSSF